MNLPAYFRLLRLDKPIGIYLLLWPTLWALWLAKTGVPDSKLFVIFVSGVIIMRSAGCILNDIADRHLDVHVERTRKRPLACKEISLTGAIGMLLLLLLLAFGLVLLLNEKTLFLAAIAVCITAFYPFMKRVTHWPQLVLGIAFSMSIPMVFMATLNAIPIKAWFLFATSILWPLIYDTQYALADIADDRKIGIKSTAILFGQHVKIILAGLQLTFLLLLVSFGFIANLNCYYFGSLVCVGALFIYQGWLMRENDPAKCFAAFLNHQWVGFIIFLGIVLQ